MLHSPGPTEQSPASVGITLVNVNCAWAVCQWSMYRPGYTGLAWSPPMAALTRCAVTQCPPLTPGLQPDADGCETRNCLSSPARAEHQTQATARTCLAGWRSGTKHTCPHSLLHQESCFVCPHNTIWLSLDTFDRIFAFMGPRKAFFVLELKVSLF